MTADAKVGLLLALVFIVAIAFVINGLPRFWSKPQAGEITIEAISKNPGESVESLRRIAIDINTQQSAAQANSGASAEPEKHVRYSRPLPAVSRVNTAEAAGNKTEMSLDEMEVVSLADAYPQKFEIVKPKPQNINPVVKQTMHVVQSGDSLASIAKKYYGPEEGNRRANINRIFEANRDNLDEPDELFVGQKLTIPPLEGGDKKSSLLAKAKRFSTRLGLLNSKAAKQNRIHVVQSGDSLWLLAEKYLGDGNRWSDILEANEDTISDADNLREGLRLIIPKR